MKHIVRLVWEALEIQTKKGDLNKEDGVHLSVAWLPAIELMKNTTVS